MVEKIVEALHALFDPQIAVWANQLHLGLLSLVGFAWLWPMIRRLYRRVMHVPEDTTWYIFWLCPMCNTYNRRTAPACTHCEHRLQSSFFERWIPLWLSEGAKTGHKRFISVYRALGWFIFYASTIVAAFKYKLFTFSQNPVVEILACAAFALLLVGLAFFRSAFRPVLKSPFGAVLDIMAGLAAVGLSTMVTLVWLQIPVKPMKPVAFVRMVNQGQLEVYRPGEKPIHVAGQAAPNAVKVDLKYAIFDWPFLKMRYVGVLRAGETSLVPAWKSGILDLLAGNLQKESMVAPRVIQLTQMVSVPMGPPQAVYEALPSGGLALRSTQ